MDRSPVRPHVFLIGFRGAGKTTVGRLLARRLGARFVDVDDVIAKRTGRPAGEILARCGEPEFRRIEATALESAVRGSAAVIATGGGVVTRAANRAVLRRTGLVVWLRVGAAETVRRLARGRSRPALTTLSLAAEARLLLKRRAPLYRSAADVAIRCGADSPNRLADRIARLVHRARDR